MLSLSKFTKSMIYFPISPPPCSSPLKGEETKEESILPLGEEIRK